MTKCVIEKVHVIVEYFLFITDFVLLVKIRMCYLTLVIIS